MQYFQYTRSEFEQLLSDVCKATGVPGKWVDITELWTKDHDIALYERIYCVPTINRSVDIIVYSSVDIRTHKVREYGADRVRVIYRWRTKNGNIYRHIHWHNRLVTLFKNLRSTVESSINGAMKLPYQGWAEGVDGLFTGEEK